MPKIKLRDVTLGDLDRHCNDKTSNGAECYGCELWNKDKDDCHFNDIGFRGNGAWLDEKVDCWYEEDKVGLLHIIALCSSIIALVLSLISYC